MWACQLLPASLTTRETRDFYTELKLEQVSTYFTEATNVVYLRLRLTLELTVTFTVTLTVTLLSHSQADSE